MKPEIEIQRASAEAGIPADEEFRGWAEAILRSSGTFHALTIRIVDEPESRRLNREYRHKDHPTNVLSFVYELPSAVMADLHDGGAPVPLGDLVICAPVVAREASEQGKPLLHHWAHLSVHGILHLLGHDHQDPEQALEMEGLERKLLESLGIPDPYLPP